MNKLVSIKVPVMNAFQDMGIDIGKDIPVFTRWAMECETGCIDSYYSYRKKIGIATISHCTAEVPDDAAFIQKIISGDHGCDCWNLFTGWDRVAFFNESSDNFFYVAKPDLQSGGIYGLCGWEVQAGSIVFPFDRNKEKITIQYLGFECDEDGFPKVMENHVQAIVEYIMYRYCVRSRYSPLKMDHSDIMRHKKEYESLVREARATDGMLTDSDREYI